MKRDMELIRKLMLRIEQYDQGTKIDGDEYLRFDEYAPAINLRIDEKDQDYYDVSIVAYHCQLLKSAGYVYSFESDLGNTSSGFKSVEGFSVVMLTWEGHNFLDTIHSDTTWNEIKSVVKKQVLPFTFATVKELAIALAPSLIIF